MPSTDLAIRAMEQGESVTVMEGLAIDLHAATTPAEAYEVMAKAKIVSDFLVKARGPREQAWECAKVSVLASRKLGRMLLELPSTVIRAPGHRGGTLPSLRYVAAAELELTRSATEKLCRVAAIPDPDFQRYIQDRSRFPSISGAHALVKPRFRTDSAGVRHRRRRRRVGVELPRASSVDELLSLLRRAAGQADSELAVHLGQLKPQARRDIKKAQELIYDAIDLVHPWTSGYQS